MKLPSFKRIFSGDFKKEDRDLITRIALIWNSSIESLYDAFNRKITLKDNIYCTIPEINVIVNSQGVPVPDVSFSVDLTTTIQMLTVGRVENLTNSTSYPIGGVTVSWTQNGQVLTISHITGLEPNKRYSIRMIAWG